MGREAERRRCRYSTGPSIDDNRLNAEETYPRQQPQDGPGMREEGDRIEGEAPGLPGAVRARWLHPSEVSAT